MNSNSKQSYIFFAVGLVCIAIGIGINEWTIASWLSYGGNLRVFDRTVIWALDIALVLGGGLLIYKRHIVHVGKAELLLLGGTAALLLVGSEIAARIIDAAHGNDFLQNKERAQRGIIPFRMFGPDWYTEENNVRYIVGRHGEPYPLKKSDKTFRIVAMGGSTTQDNVGDMHYPLRLEQLLQEAYPEHTIEVINVGNSAYATPHLIILLTLDVLSWNPDLIIASENINDLLAAYFPDFAFDYSNKYSNKAFLPRPSTAQFLFGWSRLYWVLRSRGEALSYKSLEAHDAVYTRRSYGDSPPEENRAVFQRNWETFADIVRSRGIPLILASQPLEPSEEYWDRHMRYKKYNTAVTYPLHEEFLLHHAAYNSTIQEVSRDRGVYFIDNAVAFAGRRELFSDFVHYTSLGIEELAQQYATFIKRHHSIR